MKINLVDGLPFVSVILHNGDQTIRLDHVVLDTGSATSIFKTDDLAQIGVLLEPDDPIQLMSGVGGVEFLITKIISAIQVGRLIQ